MIRTDRDSRGVFWVRLDRTEKLNALDEQMIAELIDSFESASQDEDVRVVVLGADGKLFCAGADIDWMVRQSEQDATANLEDAKRFSELLRAVHECARPVIARIHGHAFGAGVGLIAAADIAISVPEARFAISEARFGIPPAVVGPYIMHAIGPRHARRLAMTAEQISADEAHRLSLVHELAPNDQLDAVVERVVGQLLSNGPTALSEIKSLYRTLYGAEIDAALREFTTVTMARMRGSDEAREGFAAFLEKRPAEWTQQG